MLAEIITIGDEILIGQIVDTNSAWIGQQFNLWGIKVKQITSVSDNRDHILEALSLARKRADIVLITGGLGPTRDDITKHTLCEFFGTNLVFSEAVYADVERLFAGFGREVTELNRLQAMVPANCIPLSNKNGTAPGMWFEDGKNVFISLPGVPYEMKGLVMNEVIPRLSKKFSLPSIFHKTMLTQGIGESMLAERIASWEDSLPEHLKLAYLPSPGMVRLRLSAFGKDLQGLEKEVNDKFSEVLPLIESYVYGFNDDTLESVIGELLLAQKATLVTAESCTGGYIAHRITSVAGSSNYFLGGTVVYHNDEKHRLLGVDPDLIRMHGAVSQQVVEQMAKGAVERSGADYAISSSGIAGPGGATPDKPVGTVWIGMASGNRVVSRQFRFGDNRERNIQRATLTALNLFRRFVKGEEI